MADKMYDLGILGGMGPEATAEIFRRLVNMTDANSDQEHIMTCILNKTNIPDRTDYIVGNGMSPLPAINEGIEDLLALGTKRFIIPCNTAHFFTEIYSNRTDLKFINMVEVTKKYILNKFGNAKVCVLGTTGTSNAKIYSTNNFEEDLLDTFYPDKDEQKELMDIITSVKGKKAKNYSNTIRLINVMNNIIRKCGDCIFILACTELSVISPIKIDEIVKFVDAMDVLVVNSIIECGYKVDRESVNLDIDVIESSLNKVVL